MGEAAKPLYRKTFTETGTFKALFAAEHWLQERGFSFGSNQRGAPTGVLHGDYLIAKWRNLSRQERFDLDGTIDAGDHREGPVTITIFATASNAARRAIEAAVQ